MRKRSVATKVLFDAEQSLYAKFLKNEEKIRNLATADPNSYAAIVVKSMNHAIAASELIKEHLSRPHEVYEVVSVTKILKEYASSMRTSELFTVWSVDRLRAIKNMANETVKRNGWARVCDLDRDARVCLVVIMNQIGIEESIRYIRTCRLLYPDEIFFHRVFSDLFTYTEDWDSGLRVSEEMAELYPNDAEILNSRAGLLRLAADKQGDIDYKNWNWVKKQIDEVKEAYKNYLRNVPKDHRHYAENNYVMAYLSLKYATPSSQMGHDDLEEINIHFHNGLLAEKDVLPCFLPFHSNYKDIVARYVNVRAPISIEITEHGLTARPHTGPVPLDHVAYIDMRKPPKRRIDLSVSHRQRLKNMLSDPATAVLAEHNDKNTDSNRRPVKNGSDNCEEIVLYQMTFARVSETFTAKVIQLTVVEDSMYDSGFLETVVADKIGDVIRLQLDVGAVPPDNRTLMKLMRKFRFGTVWKLRSPDFHIGHGDESTMYIRASPEGLIPTKDGQNRQNGRKCRLCFKALNPGQICAKCKTAGYCGKECQTQDWKCLKHSLICSEAYKNLYN